MLRKIMEEASVRSATRTPIHQKVGDFWAACMDEKAIDVASKHDLALELRRIGAMHGKRELAVEVAHLHTMLPAAWKSDSIQALQAFFGFSSSQDLDNASMVVVEIDQGGMGLPSRDFYLKEDPQSTEIRSKYRLHVGRMLALSGESDDQSAKDAETVLALETGMAKV